MKSHGLEVTPMAEGTKFEVESISGRNPHVVDLASYGGVGSCTCEHFNYRLRRVARQGTELNELCRCAHIEAAREVALDLTVAAHEKGRTGGRKEDDGE